MELSAIRLYPIKSCAGIAVDQWHLDRFGLELDRSHMVIDSDGGFLTQRELPAMATIVPTVNDAGLSVSTPAGTVSVPLDGPIRSATVWRHTGPVQDCGDDAASLLSEHLSRRVRLVRLSDDHGRLSDSVDEVDSAPVSFADGFPLLIATTASLADLNARLDSPLPMERFRPNLVIEGTRAFAEDGWRRIRVGAIEIDVVSPCARCTITTVDQATGRRSGGEPLRTLGTFRRGSKGVLFAMNAIHRGQGLLSVGDPVAVAAH